PLFLSNQNNVCIKQAFYRQEGGTTAHVHQGVSQGKYLMVEMNCLGWGNSLLCMVYDFIGEKPTISVPYLRFVGAGLAIAQNPDRDTFLVEELIDKTPFVKYINNDSAKPCDFLDTERSCIARFLAFSQHVQWMKTKGLVYVSDYQGSGVLLTDPQIITRP
ncbi:hypothetical protein BT96DRAFT_752565, partial [Gymnopus androsaceus JB14]